MDAEASALAAYARGVSDIKDQQVTLETRRADTLEDLETYQQEKQDAYWDEKVWLTLEHADRYEQALTLIDDAEDELANIEHQWQILARTVRRSTGSASLP